MNRLFFIGISLICLPLSACSCGCAAIEASDRHVEMIPSDLEYYTGDNLQELHDEIMRASLERSSRVWKLIDRMKVVDPDCPILTDLEDGSILFKGGIALSDLEKEELAKFFKGCGLCDDVSDVEFSGVDVHVITPWCKKKVPVRKATDEAWCQDNCDTLTFGLQIAACRLPFKCQSRVSIAIEAMRRACKWCCEGGGWLNTCLWPLRDYCVACDWRDID
jgi:hypothetical protein